MRSRIAELLPLLFSPRLPSLPFSHGEGVLAIAKKGNEFLQFIFIEGADVDLDWGGEVEELRYHLVGLTAR